MQASSGHLIWGIPEAQALPPQGRGSWMTCLDQPVDPLVERQAPQERDLPGRRCGRWGSLGNLLASD